MAQTYLNQVLPFLETIDKKRRVMIEEYFNSAPVWLMDSFKVMSVKKGSTLVQENAPVDTVYIIGTGVIKGVDYRMYGTTYDFMRFDGVYALGGMEIVMDIDTYRTTLVTATDCIVIVIPRREFEKWLNTDIKALKQEAKAIGNYLLEEGRNERAFLFLQGADRLCMLLSDLYEKNAKSDQLELKSTRQELSEQSGLCVKTVNRAVKKFEKEHLIGRNGNRITISREQYQQMKQVVAELVDQ